MSVARLDIGSNGISSVCIYACVQGNNASCLRRHNSRAGTWRVHKAHSGGHGPFA